MRTIIKRRLLVKNCNFSKPFYTSVLLMVAGLAACIAPQGVHAGGVHFGFGVDVPFGEPAPPPVAVYAPPVVVERPVPPPVVVERRVAPPAVVVENPAPPVVVVRRAPPTVVYEGPVVVERRSTTTYYYPSPYQGRSYREETEQEHYRRRSSTYYVD